MTVQALVSLKREDLPAIGRDRVRLLEAVAREGGISAGARAVGLTYRAAWDALDAMSNVFAAPLIETRIGGREKGGATLTETGRRVIAAFHRLEAEMARLTSAFDAELAGSGVSSRDMAAGFFFKTSARNALRGVVRAMDRRALSCDVTIALNARVALTAHVTSQSVADLGLHSGRDVLALIKAPLITIAAPASDPAPERAERARRNVIPGTVRRCDYSDAQAEIILDIGDGKTIAALMRAKTARAAHLVVDQPAFALFDAANVILALEW